MIHHWAIANEVTDAATHAATHASTYVSSNAEIEALPEPLTLDFALSLSIKEHPAIVQAAANIKIKQSIRNQVDATHGFNVGLRGQAKYIETQSFAIDQSNNDSQVHLLLGKRLYDFGKTRARTLAAEAGIEASESLYVDAVNQHRINIMQRFFSVLLADLKYIRDNEAMSIAFVRADRAREHRGKGQLSDIEVLEKERSYQDFRRKFYQSRALQQITRNQLANILNRPGRLSTNVAEPNIKGNSFKVPPIDDLQKLAAKNNPFLISLRKQVQADKQEVDAVRASKWPIIDSKLKISDYQRKSSGYNRYEAQIVLDVPILDGGKADSGVVQRDATLRRSMAELRAAESKIQEAVLVAWQHLDVLRIQRQEMLSLREYRELYLDRSRTLYEMEVNVDLGDSMVLVSDARLKFSETEYDIILSWARLKALIGDSVLEVLQ
jgi:outer membrane protein TolC